MAENDSMEGKKLELYMFEQKVLEAIELAEKEKADSEVIDNGKIPFEIKIEKIDKKIKIHAFGEEILTLEEDKFVYNIEGLKNVQEKLKENPEFDYGQFGLPDLEYLEELERQKEENSKDEDQKDEEDLSEDIDEKEDEERDTEKERETEDRDKDEIARRYRVNPNLVVHISTGARSKRVTDDEHFANIAKWAEKYDDIFILPGKNEYSWETIGVNKDGEEEVINNRQQEGENPDVTIKMEKQNSSEIEEVRPLAMYKIDSKTSYAIIRDNAGKTQAILCRQEEGKGKEYWGQVIPEAQGKNVREASPESRETISPEHYSSYDLAKRGQAFEEAKSLEERGYPSKEGKGVQMEEITGTPTQNRELSKEAIINDLADRVIAASSMPINRNAYIKIHQEELNKKADKILDMGEEHEDITYEEALKEVESQSKEAEEDQKTPDQNPRRRGH